MRLHIVVACLIGSGIDALKCNQCQHTMNSLNETDGSMGDKRCWEDPNSIDATVDCNNPEGCTTDLRATWSPYGQQLFTVIRGCGLPQNCFENTLDSYRSKQCRTVCQSSDQCNSDLTVANWFTSQNNQENCQACRYHVNDDGSESGNTNCGSNAINNLVDCPLFANSGCYNGASSHTMDDGQKSDSFRGCSAFTVNPNPLCTTFDQTEDGQESPITYGVCKETCQGSNCNNLDITQPDLTLNYPTCQICAENQDQDGQSVGAGDVGCFQGDVKYESACSSTTSMCATEMTVDWTAKGNIMYGVTRKCVNSEPTIPCQQGSSTTLQYKDCTAVCDPTIKAGCNNDLSTIENLVSPGNIVSSCYNCGFYEDFDGIVQGNENCRDSPNQKQSCPAYSDASCYTAVSYHKSYSGIDTTDREDDYRGCSPFTLDDGSWENCGNILINGYEHANCKTTCVDKDDCNSQSTDDLSDNKIKCYSCSGARDSTGSPVSGDDKCFDAPSDNSFITCDVGEICQSELLVDWYPAGNQVAVIKRGCYKIPEGNNQDIPEPSCSEASNPSVHYSFKDCYQYCGTSGCNNDMSIGDLFASANNQRNCQTCSYEESDNGDRFGNPACLNSGTPNSLKSCPSYANAGCYMGNNVHTADDGTNKYSVTRGCSSFDVDYDTNCYEVNNDDAVYSVCKDFCIGENCNNRLPSSPIANGNEWPSCLVCSTTVDTNNATVGSVDENCWNLDMSVDNATALAYLERCPSINDRCITEMEADWYPRGNVQYNLKRYCSSAAVPPKCFEGQSDLMQYKDCSTGCNPLVQGAGCNGGLDAVSALFSVGTVTQCQNCQYFQDFNGDSIGIQNCGDAYLTANSISCPAYATASCFEAASFHQSYTNPQQIQDSYRGCSPFTTPQNNENSRCTSMILQGLDHSNCRRNCYSDDCNTEELQQGKTCYSCSGVRDSMGNPNGAGDDNCFENLSDRLLVSCSPDQNFCVTEMLTDWLAKGQQLTTIKRGCSTTPAPIACKSGATNNIKYKDCLQTCDNSKSACNNDLSVGDLFKPESNPVKSCYSCYYIEHDDGSVEGNKNCFNNVDDMQNPTMNCPVYASTSCYSGAAVHSDLGQLKNQIFKGCSSYNVDGGLEEYEMVLPDDLGNAVGFSITKESCDNDDCNAVHKAPEVPAALNSAYCQVCSVTVDAKNQTIGVGQNACWLGSSDYLQECGIGFNCITDMEADWLPTGAMQWRVIRGCTQSASKPLPCVESQTAIYSIKDCQDVCNPMVDGQGCNNGLKVAERFDAGDDERVNSCYTCSFVQSPNGDINGQETCGTQIQNTTLIRTQACPLYANAGCHHSASFHIDYTNDDQVQEDDYRGCSTWASSEDNLGQSGGYKCHDVDMNGLQHESCKAVCIGDNCNTRSIQEKRPMCYTCQVTKDSSGNVVGVGDDRCWTLYGDPQSLVRQCPRGQNYCSDEMLVDWLPTGAQQVTLKRGCSAEPAKEACNKGDSPAIKYKDCFETCLFDDKACNNGLGVQQKFVTGDAPQKSCYTCDYNENYDGDLQGNKNCPDSPNSDMSMSCPVYATAGCYTGSSVHLDTSGKGYEQVSKGCSTFKTDGTESTNGLISNIEYSMVKEFCFGENCNKGHVTPKPPARPTPGTKIVKSPRFSAYISEP